MACRENLLVLISRAINEPAVKNATARPMTYHQGESRTTARCPSTPLCQRVEMSATLKLSHGLTDSLSASQRSRSVSSTEMAMTMNAANAGAANVSAFSLILDGRSDASFPLSFAVVLLLRP